MVPSRPTKKVRRRSISDKNRKTTANPRLESLEKRELLAAEILGHALFAPGTSADIVRSAEEFGGQAGSDGPQPVLAGNRWNDTALGVEGTTPGSAATVTWSIVRDGTPMVNPNTGANEGTSDLIAFLDGIYGDGGVTEPSEKPWFKFIEGAYDRWGEVSGLNLVYEPFDDGADVYANASRGVAGVRGDMRIAGGAIDGNSNVLAFNYFPNQFGSSGSDGDMKIDTTDDFYLRNSDGPDGINTALFNIIAHEAGHGLGLGHTEPVNGTKLMEPFINLSFFGPQEDDIYDAQELYGDPLEPNDTIANATDLGTLRNESAIETQNSIDNDTDTDLYRFELVVPTVAAIQITPTGSAYDRGPQGGTPSPVDRLREADLSFRVLDSNGIEVTLVDAAPIGSAESIEELELDAGEYFVEVAGSGDTQLYDMSLTIGRPFTFRPSDGAPRLTAVNPDADEVFANDELNVRLTSPRELTFRFTGDSDLDPTTIPGGIRIFDPGTDGLLGTFDDVPVTHDRTGELLESVHFELADLDSGIVRMRFAEPLADSRYRIEVFGEDLAAENITAIRNLDGAPLAPRLNGTASDIIDFEIELGARVVSVVPQPVSIDSDGISGQERSKIHVYFDDDDLFAGGGTATLRNPNFYQLIATNETLTPNDDLAIVPATVTVEAFETRQVPDPANPGSTIGVQVRVNRVELDFGADLDTLAGEGTYRLQIGSSTPVASATNPSTVNNINFVGDVSDRWTTAAAINPINQTLVISQSMTDGGLPFDYPGRYDEVGHRDIPDQQHVDFTDTNPGLSVREYNFAETGPYHTYPDGTELFTSINEEQKERFREIFELWGRYLGIEFVETAASGIQLVVGDLDPAGFSSGVGGTLGAANSTRVIMDAAENWYDGYGRSSDGRFSFFETALHEVGHSIGLGHSYGLAPSTIMGSEPIFGADPEFAYPGNADIIHGRHLYRPDNRDIDFYRFEVPVGQAGSFRAETISERAASADPLDTHLTLYRLETDGTLTLLSANDDSFGDDAAITQSLDEGNYLIAVTPAGNEDFTAATNYDSGSGGTTQGDYQLRVRFDNERSTSLLDAAGTAFDGDADGKPGGTFDFFFRAHSAGNTLFVDATAPDGGSGLATSPLNNIGDALAMATEGQTVRIVGNTGADANIGLESDDFDAASDNIAYTIGRIDSIGQTLDDGRNLIVPAGVNVVIDAGVVIKMAGSRILVGSDPGGADASGGTLQLLGTPDLPVFLTSFNDTEVGLQSNPLGTPASTGDWGGIDIRDGVDRAQGRERNDSEGLFVNAVFNSRIRYGGGSVFVNGQLEPIDAIRLDASRPTLIGNVISDSASAAISADPASFRESYFVQPIFQRGQGFDPGYNRIGPEIYGNILVDNSINGLLVRIDTQAGGVKEKVVNSARFDDTDIVHVLGDDLVIAGNPSGAIVNERPPAPALTSLTPIIAPGADSLDAGDYRYRVSLIDVYGNETPASDATPIVTVAAGEAVQLGSLPIADGEFVSRRLYRSFNGGGYRLVASLDRATTSHLDDIETPLTTPPIPDGQLRNRLDGRLIVDPGIVIKSDGVRIEAEFGADFIAEGTEGLPIIMTSRSDDRYGAGGTFDSTSDGDTPTAPGDWAGVYARPNASISLDHVVFANAGGQSSVDGTTVSFNPIGIYQADARIANTTFQNNADGSGSLDPLRASLGPNDASTIYVAGAQPIIINNSFESNANGSAAISINVNSMSAHSVSDLGRQTGAPDRFDDVVANAGPLVRGNQFDGTGISGMRIRGEVLASEVVFDDTDIVHVVTSSITDSNLHTEGGLRLQSRVDESLVVKFDNGTFLRADGRPLDIDDRVGGRLQVIGQPGHPVILTSINDDTVGAGLNAEGQSVTDTAGDGETTGSPGDWTGLQIHEFAHDRNVEVIVESESRTLAGADPNGSPQSAQPIGQLAASEKSSDDNLRLGFSVYGAIASPGDIDTYSFRATAGTTVWLDIDRTSNGLNSIIELVASDGTVLARSDDSLNETNAVDFSTGDVTALPMRQDAYAELNAINDSYRDSFTLNPLDAGMRVQLPGAAGVSSEYFVRVTGGVVDGSTPRYESQGSYQLNVRLREADEFAGSTIQYADVRFAQVGIDVRGGVTHSPLVGEASGGNGTVVNLGSLGSTDRAVVSVAGRLAGQNSVDRYRFTVGRDALQSGGATTGLPVTFDVDYADGLTRPDTTLLLYYLGQNGASAPQLVMIGRDSNIAADRSNDLFGADLQDLSRGSVGSRDAFLGTVQLISGQYEVAVVGASQVPTEFDQYFVASSTNPNLRLEPISSVRRIAEDRFGGVTDTVASPPVTTVFEGTSNAVPWSFGDTELIFTGTTNVAGAGGSVAQVTGSINAQTGQTKGFYNTLPQPTATSQYQAVTTTAHGVSFAVDVVDGQKTDANSQRVLISTPGNPFTLLGNTGIQTFEAYPNAGNPVVNQAETNDVVDDNRGDGMIFSALTTYIEADGTLRLFGVASRGNGQNTFRPATLDAQGAINGLAPLTSARHYLYEIDPTTGVVINASNNGADRAGDARATGAGTNKVEYGRISVATGDVTALIQDGNDLLLTTDTGQFIRINGDPGAGNELAPTGAVTTLRNIGTVQTIAPLGFIPRGITRGPEGLPNIGATPSDEVLFFFDDAGVIYARDASNNPVPAFAGGESTLDPGELDSLTSISFNNLIENPWAVSNERSGDAGHGTGTTQFDDRDVEPGGNSLRFGYERPNGDNNPTRPTDNRYDYSTGAHGQVESNTFDLTGHVAEDKPTLYFSYLLDTEDADNPIVSNNQALDAFRVYVSSDDSPEWTLVATNNATQQGHFANPRPGANEGPGDASSNFDEFDIGHTGYVDANGRRYVPSTLHDVTDWRQARVELAPWAGQRNVRIRFDFNSAGEAEIGVASLRTVSADRLLEVAMADREFSVEALDDNTLTETFAYDLGLVLEAPAGSAINDGDTFELVRGNGSTQVFTFVETAGAVAADQIAFESDLSAAAIANRIRAALNLLGGVTTQVDIDQRDRFSVRDTTGNANLATTGPLDVLATGPAATSTPIIIDINDDSDAVAVTTQATVADTLDRAINPAGLMDPLLALDIINSRDARYPVHNSTVRLHGFRVTDAGALSVFQNDLTVGGSVAGSESGAYVRTNELGSGANRYQNLFIAGQRQQNNGFEGVFVDDVIIGFAERGEAVLGAAGNPTTATTIANPLYELPIQNNGNRINVIDAGQFQLEVRLSAAYTYPGTVDPARSWTTNSVLGETVALDFANVDAFSLADPDAGPSRFIPLSDGDVELRFEFENLDGGPAGNGVTSGAVAVGYQSNMSPAELAQSFREAINATALSSGFGILAISADGVSNGPSSSAEVLLVGNAASNLTGAIDFDANIGALGVTQFGPEFIGPMAPTPSPLIPYGSDHGDENAERAQGQLIIRNNVVTDASQFGISVDSGRRNRGDTSAEASSTSPRPGSPRAFATGNPGGLVPGAVLVNNVLADNAAGGISLSGDITTVGGVAPSPFARVINNTIVGGNVGILVNQGAAPTIINNAIVGTGTGVSADGTINDMELFANLYAENTRNTLGTGVGGFAIFSPNADAVFVDDDGRNFYPVSGSNLIDNSLLAVDDRFDLQSLRNSLGIAPSPILAPLRDSNGQVRADDPTANNTSGTGSNVFIDVGALDRADFAGPLASIIDPLDDDVEGIDLDRNRSFVQLSEGTYDRFEIKLSDLGGVGIDDASVLAEAITISQDGRILVEDVDYQFGYSASNDTITLKPVTGIWVPGSAYEITLNNRDRTVFRTNSGDTTFDGETLTIVDGDGNAQTFEYDSGNVIRVGQSQTLEVIGDLTSFVDRATFDLTSADGNTTVSFEIDKLGGTTPGNIPVDLTTATTDAEIRDALLLALTNAAVPVELGILPRAIGDRAIQLGGTGDIVITNLPAGLVESGLTRGVVDGDRLRLTIEGTAYQFEFDNSGAADPFAIPGNLNPATTDVIPIIGNETPSDLADKIVAVMTAAGIDAESTIAFENGVFRVGGGPDDTLELISDGLLLLGRVGTTSRLSLRIDPAATGGSISGAQVTIDSDGTTETFLLTTDSAVVTTDTIVLLDPTDDAAEIGDSLANAISLTLAGFAASSVEGIVQIGEPTRAADGTPITTTVTETSPEITVDGIGGGAIALPFDPSAGFSAESVAGIVISAISRSGLNIVPFTPGGGLVYLDNVTTLSGPSTGLVGAIEDLARNNLQSNRINLETQFTVLMPGVELDFGDAPSGQYATLAADNGPRHTLAGDRTPRLGNVIDTELDAESSDDTESTIIISAPASIGVASIAGGESLTLTPATAAGDTVTVNVDAITPRTYEFVLGGDEPLTPGAVGVLIIPDEPPAVTARRLAATIEADLKTAAPTASIDYTVATPTISILSIDDEDGLGIGSVNVAGNTLDGVFVDTTGTEVIGFLNPLAAEGSLLLVNATGNGLLDGWVDFNGDGDFTDPGEQVLSNQPVIDGENTVRVFTPADAGVAAATGSGMTWARFRVSNTGNTLPTGIVLGGEVEDYQVVVVAAALPEANDDSDVIAEDGISLGNVATNDILNGATTTTPQPYALLRQPSNGTVTLDPATGDFEYTPNADFYGDDFFVYQIVGTQTVASGLTYPVQSEPATVAIRVTPVNDLPVAVDQNFVTTEPSDTNTATTITITASDLLTGASPHVDSATLLPPWNELEQTLSVVQIGVIDSTGSAADVIPATSITEPIDGIYTADTYVLDSVGTPVHAGSISVTVLGQAVTQIEFTPTANYNELNPTDGLGATRVPLVYTVADDGLTILPNDLLAVPQPGPETTTANVLIRVTPHNDSPITADDLYDATTARQPVEDAGDFVIPFAELLANDTQGDVDSTGVTPVVIGSGDENGGPAQQTLTLVVEDSDNNPIFPLTTAAGGSVTLNAAGDLVYRPLPEFYGPDSFTYTVIDSGTDIDVNGGVTDNFKTSTSTVNLFVAPQNDIPSTTDKLFTTDEDTPLTITAAELHAGSAGDADPLAPAPFDESNQLLNIISISHGGVTVSNNTASNELVTPRGRAIANFDSGTGLLIDLVYVPNLDLNATDYPNLDGSDVLDEFTFTVIDDGRHPNPDGGDDLQTVRRRVNGVARINVVSINDAPDFDQPVDRAIDEDAPTQTVTISGIVSGETDPISGRREPQPLEVRAVSSNIGLVDIVNVTYSSPDGTATIDFKSLDDTYGTTTISITVEDGGLDQDLSTTADNLLVTKSFALTVNPINDIPDTIDKSFATDEDTALTITAAELYAGSTGDADPLAPAPQDEANQTFQIVGLTSGTETIDSSTTATLKTPRGTIVANFDAATGFLIDLEYTPDLDLNATDYPNLDGSDVLDEFTFTVADDGVHLDPADTDASDGIDVLATTSPETVDGVARINVASINDAPDFDQPVDLAIDEDAPVQTVTISGIVSGETDPISGRREPQPLEVRAVSSNTGLVDIVNVTYSSPDGTATIDFQSLGDTYGTSTISVTVEDGGLDQDLSTTADNLLVTKSFVLTVAPVNDAPATTDKSFTTNEDTALTITAAELYTGSIGDADPLAPAPQDEANQTFQIVGLTSGTETIDSSTTATLKTPRGTVIANFDAATGFLIDLEYTPDLDLNATDYPNPDGSDVLDEFTFTVADDGVHLDPADTDASDGIDVLATTAPETVDGVARIRVIAINDAPDFDQPNDVTIDEDAATEVVVLTGIEAGGNEPQTMQITATSSNTFLIPVVNVAYDGTGSLGALAFEPQPDRYGSTTITVTLTDAGQDNDLATTADNLVTVKTFEVTVDPVNDTPGTTDKEFATLEETAITISAAQLLVGSRGDFDPQQAFPQDESGQTVRVLSLQTLDGTVTAANAAGATFATPRGSLQASFDTDGFLIDLVYTPNLDFNSDNPLTSGLRTQDEFGFTVADDGLTVLESGGVVTLPPETGTATVRMTVTPRNDAPEASNDTVDVNDPRWIQYFNDRSLPVPTPTEDTDLVIPGAFLLGNDLAGPITAGDENLGTNDNDRAPTLVGDSLTTDLGGTVTFLQNGNLLYEPPENVSGLDTFVYTITDAGENEDTDGTRNISPLTDTAVVTINIAAVNDRPTFDIETAVTLPEDATRNTFITDIRAGGGEDQPLRVSVVSEDPSLIGDPVINYSPATETAVLTLTPEPDQFGVTRMIVTVEDAGLDGDFDTTDDNQSLTRTFVVRINAVNDDPEIDALADRDIDENADEQTVNLTGINAGGGETQPLLVTVASDNPALTGPLDLTYVAPADTGSFVFTPVADAFGTATISVTVTDGGSDLDLSTTADNGQTVRTFTVNVASINDDPTLDAIDDQTIPEDAPVQTLTLSGISDGPLESGVVTIAATSDNPGLIADPVIGPIGADGTATLSYSPLGNQAGTATISVVVTDDGNGGLESPRTLTRMFVVTVNAVNDAPTLDPIDDQSINEDSTESILLTGISAGGGEMQDLSITATSGAPGLVLDPIVGTIAADGTASLDLTSIGDASGNATITVVVEDAGLDGDLATPGDNRTVSHSFVVRVQAVNDPPTIDPVAPVTVDEDSGVALVDLSGITAGILESGRIEVTAVSDDPDLLTNVSAVHDGILPVGTLRFEPVADAFGTGTITVTVTDGGADNDLSTPNDNLTTTTTVEVSINAINDAPTLPLISVPTEIDEDSAPVTFDVSPISGGPGESGDVRVSVVSSDPSRLGAEVISYDPTTGQAELQLSPAANAFGFVSIDVTVTDPGQDGDFDTPGDNLSVTATYDISIIGSDDPPVANDDVLDTDEDSIATIEVSGLLANDTDPDLGPGSSESLSISLPSLTTTLGASLSFDPETGTVTYDPTAIDAIQALQVGDTPLVDSFVYELSDADGESPAPTATVSINIEGLNDAPRVTDDVPPFEMGDGFFVIRPLANDTDIDGTIDVNSLIITSDPAFGSVDRQVVNGEVVLTYSPSDEFDGTDSFRYTVEDDDGQVSAQATVFIRPSSGPAIGVDSVPGRVGQSTSFDVLANDIASTGTVNRSSARIIIQPQNGVAEFDANGLLVYTPNDGFVGTDTFSYGVSDSEGNESISAPMNINVVQSGRTNALNPFDVNANGVVTPLDGLLVINYLRAQGRGSLVPVGPDETGPSFYDTNDSMTVSPIDALNVINYLRRVRNSTLGESASQVVTPGLLNTPVADLGDPIVIDTITTVTPQVSVTLPRDPEQAPQDLSGDTQLADQAVADWNDGSEQRDVLIDEIVDSEDEAADDSIADVVFDDWNL